MSDAPSKFILTRPETWQFRRTQSLDPAFAQEVQRVCEANEAIRACSLLDTRKREGSELKLTIALSLEDEDAQLECAAMQFQVMLPS